MLDAEKTIGNVFDKQSTVFVSSIDSDGFPVCKAMLKPRRRDGISVIWFSTNTSSQKVQNFTKNPKGAVYFMDRQLFKAVHLRVLVEVLEDEKHKEMFWQAGDETYYSLGVTDPDYCVLKCTILTGRYYANFKSEDFTVQEGEDVIKKYPEKPFVGH